MFKLSLKELFAERGVKFPYNTLLRLGIGRATAKKMLSADAVQIRFDHLLKLCLYLNCTPKEVLKLYPEPNDTSFENTPLSE